ncbi:MAG: bifunctional folylpolyglutamate synthase/dihydrofolate synthase [Nitratireductor sp.]|nr:bifunctional folylpolyglutamate synthase/dihydrofolate synthase [Nitratireductor sp.]
MSADSLIAGLSAIHPKGFDLSLDRITRLLARLGDPQLRIPPAIHVAGTNGKGSTVAFCRAILEAHGKAVHVHTSPHLVNWHERYRLGSPDGGGLVSEALLEDAIARVAKANNGEAITVFEILSAVMFVLFAENPADYSIIEVGLGGRFDATNVIVSPLVAVITNIALDHQAWLGDTVAAIAMEKAGIIKPGCPVAIGPQQEGIDDLLADTAEERKVRSMVCGRDYGYFRQAGRFVYQDDMGLMDLPLPALAGEHQLANAATAIAAMRLSGLSIPDEAYERAMTSVVWPGRMERLKPGKLQSRFPHDTEVWIDGGHNPSAGSAIAACLADLEEKRPLPVFMICGMINTKEPSGFLDAFRGLVRELVTVPVIDSDASIPATDLAAIATECGLESSAALSLEAGIEHVSRLSFANGPCRVIICGSLYLVGEVLRENGTPPA